MVYGHHVVCLLEKAKEFVVIKVITITTQTHFVEKMDFY